MSERTCARCDFAGNDDEAVEHARTTGHLRCIVCQRRSLTVHERQTCTSCIGRVRADLADILTGYALLEPVGTNRLTLLADGTMQRIPRPDELDRNIRDEWPSDPLPVLAALASWEDMIREDYRDGKGAVPANLSATIGYLSDNLDSRHNLAQTFHGFDDLADEIRHHRGAVHHAASLADDPVEADPECFDCGGPLLRTYRPPVEPASIRRQRTRQAIAAATDTVRRQREAERTYGIRNLTPWPSDMARDLWRQGAAGRSSEGLTDEWTCGWCRREYTQPEYFLALRAKASSWVSLTLAAETAQRSVWTVRSWANRLLVSAVCRVTDHRVLVWWPDVSDRAFRHADDTASQRSA